MGWRIFSLDDGGSVEGKRGSSVERGVSAALPLGGDGCGYWSEVCCLLVDSTPGQRLLSRQRQRQANRDDVV